MESYQLTGVLATDCQIRKHNEKQVISFSIPESKKYKDKNGQIQEKTKWVNCSWWTDSSAIEQYLTKGRTVSIIGEPYASAYIDNAGNAQAKFELRVMSLKLWGKNERSEQTHEENNSESLLPDSDDLPF